MASDFKDPVHKFSVSVDSLTTLIFLPGYLGLGFQKPYERSMYMRRMHARILPYIFQSLLVASAKIFTLNKSKIVIRLKQLCLNNGGNFYNTPKLMILRFIFIRD